MGPAEIIIAILLALFVRFILFKKEFEENKGSKIKQFTTIILPIICAFIIFKITSYFLGI